MRCQTCAWRTPWWCHPELRKRKASRPALPGRVKTQPNRLVCGPSLMPRGCLSIAKNPPSYKSQQTCKPQHNASRSICVDVHVQGNVRSLRVSPPVPQNPEILRFRLPKYPSNQRRRLRSEIQPSLIGCFQRVPEPAGCTCAHPGAGRLDPERECEATQLYSISAPYPEGQLIYTSIGASDRRSRSSCAQLL